MPQVELNIYREQLLRYLEDYQIKLDYDSKVYSEKANEKAKIVVAREFDPTDISLNNNVKRISYDIGIKTRKLISDYMRTIMFMLGRVCECIIIDNCKRDPDLNMKCINYACYKSDINEEYRDIQYDRYTPLSPSHNRIVLYSDSGIVYYKTNIYAYEPNHINKDIIWCGKESLEDILKTSIPYTKYNQDAKLQIKASTDCAYIHWDGYKYRFSPIIYFDLYRDIDFLHEYLRRRKINLYVRSVLDFDMRLMEECIWYYRLLAGHFSGLINLREEVNLNSLDTLEKAVARYIFSSDIKSLISDKSVVKSNELLNGLQNTILYDNQDNVIQIDLVE